MIEEIINLFNYSFIRNAFIVGILLSVCSALLGTTLVLKRYSMIGDGLSHVGFGAICIAVAVNLAPLTIAIPVVIVFAILLLRLSENSKIKGDSLIAIISSGALAIGVFAISISTGVNIDINSYLFGSILAVNNSDLILSVCLTVVVLTVFILLYNRIFAVTFDEDFSKATGVKIGLYNIIIAVLTAVTITLGMRIMGAMLISSLIIFPTLSAMRLCKKYKSVTIVSLILSVICFTIGLIISCLIDNAPSGACIVIVNLICFIICFILHKIISKRKVKI